ncbi:MAG: succinate dehydrogenase, cytochrome b556 subunit [Rhodobacteraceae bacterium]|nr:succinate dehydrogenase, cytochrome b556 subunit [Paracoccaceae bacterium]
MTQRMRPLSPHVMIFRWPLNAIMSIMHRITGVVMTAGGVLLVWWFLAASVSGSYFDAVNGLMTSVVGDLVMLGLLAALCHHFCNGIRHLIWDTGRGLGDRDVTLSSRISLGGSVILFAVIILVG